MTQKQKPNLAALADAIGSTPPQGHSYRTVSSSLPRPFVDRVSVELLLGIGRRRAELEKPPAGFTLDLESA